MQNKLRNPCMYIYFVYTRQAYTRQPKFPVPLPLSLLSKNFSAAPAITSFWAQNQQQWSASGPLSTSGSATIFSLFFALFQDILRIYSENTMWKYKSIDEIQLWGYNLVKIQLWKYNLVKLQFCEVQFSETTINCGNTIQ